MLRLITLLIGLLLLYPYQNHAQVSSNIAINAVGIVLDSETKKPLSGAKVTLINTQKSIKESVLTQVNGNFHFKLDRNSSYILYTANGFCSSIPRNIHTSPYETKGVYQFTLLLSAPDSKPKYIEPIPDNVTTSAVCNKVEDDASIVANKEALPQITLPIETDTDYIDTPTNTEISLPPPLAVPLALPYVAVPISLPPQNPNTEDFKVILLPETSVLPSSLPKSKVVPLTQIIDEEDILLEEKIAQKSKKIALPPKKPKKKLPRFTHRPPAAPTKKQNHQKTKETKKAKTIIPNGHKQKDNSVIKTIPIDKDTKTEPKINIVTPKPKPKNPLEELAFKVKIGTFVQPLKLDCDFLSEVKDDLSMDKLENGHFQYMVGAFTDYESAFNKKLELKKMGYENADIVVYMQNKLVKKPLLDILKEVKNYRFKQQRNP